MGNVGKGRGREKIDGRLADKERKGNLGQKRVGALYLFISNFL